MLGKDDREHDKAFMLQLLQQVQNREWFGDLTFVFQGGKIKRVRRNECILPPDSKPGS